MQTSGPGHEHWHDATGAYVLGALDAAEHAAFEEHLAGCPACREDHDSLAALLTAESVPPGARARAGVARVR
jgi:anti-sigma factor RsiW